MVKGWNQKTVESPVFQALVMQAYARATAGESTVVAEAELAALLLYNDINHELLYGLVYIEPPTRKVAMDDRVIKCAPPSERAKRCIRS